MKVLVLGAGLVGGAIAWDLSKDGEFEVTVADISAQNLERVSSRCPANTIMADLSDLSMVKGLLKQADIAVNAMPGFLGFHTFKAIIEAGKNVVDIAFFPEDALMLDQLAKECGVIAITDCGVAPGLSNIQIGRAVSQLDSVDSAIIYVGGLPKIREWPFEYKAVFSPLDVIELYTRPARYLENGVLVTRPALSDPELINFPGVGTVEAFNTDGLRSLVHTVKAKNIKEKTLRYPGHIEKMAMLRECGFFSEESIKVGATDIRPIDFTAKLLFPKWELKSGEEELTVMRVVVEGIKGSRKIVHSFDLLDHFDSVTKTTSMARTTGFTATVALRMIKAGIWKRKGVAAPELLGMEPSAYEYLKSGLSERGVSWEESVAVG